MGNVIPWSQIHPSIKSEEPFVAVVIIDPLREICVSEMVPFEPETLANPDQAAPELIAAAQAAAARVASGYRTRRKTTPSPTLPTSGGEIPKPEGGRENPAGLRVLTGGIR
jgi:hypothetical protein